MVPDGGTSGKVVHSDCLEEAAHPTDLRAAVGFVLLTQPTNSTPIVLDSNERKLFPALKGD